MSHIKSELDKIREEFKEAPELQYIWTHPESIEKPEIMAIGNWWLDKMSTSHLRLLERVESEIKDLRHEIQQDKMPLGNEQWKTGHTKCLEEVLAIINELKSIE